MLIIHPDDRELLKSLYLQYRIPSDQFKRRSSDLHRFTQQWNMLTDRADGPGELLHYMVTRRKKAEWPRLGNNHKKIETVPQDLLTVEELEALRTVYLALGKGSDNYAFNAGLRNEMENRFAAAAGRRVSSVLLMGTIEARRKRGLWVKIGGEEPFSDIDAVAT
jgi:hypothetical protein